MNAGISILGLLIGAVVVLGGLGAIIAIVVLVIRSSRKKPPSECSDD